MNIQSVPISHSLQTIEKDNVPNQWRETLLRLIQSPEGRPSGWFETPSKIAVVPRKQQDVGATAKIMFAEVRQPVSLTAPLPLGFQIFLLRVIDPVGCGRNPDQQFLILSSSLTLDDADLSTSLVPLCLADVLKTFFSKISVFYPHWSRLSERKIQLESLDLSWNSECCVVQLDLCMRQVLASPSSLSEGHHQECAFDSSWRKEKARINRLIALCEASSWQPFTWSSTLASLMPPGIELISDEGRQKVLESTEAPFAFSDIRHLCGANVFPCLDRDHFTSVLSPYLDSTLEEKKQVTRFVLSEKVCQELRPCRLKFSSPPRHVDQLLNQVDTLLPILRIDTPSEGRFFGDDSSKKESPWTLNLRAGKKNCLILRFIVPQGHTQLTLLDLPLALCGSNFPGQLDLQEFMERIGCPLSVLMDRVIKKQEISFSKNFHKRLHQNDLWSNVIVPTPISSPSSPCSPCVPHMCIHMFDTL